jgi:hypothetical protein
MKTIIQKPIHHLCSENLPSEIIADMLGDAEIQCHEIYEGNTAQLNDPIKIDVLRGLLDDLESRGANYVSIDFHNDHQEFELDGIFITTATPEEVIIHEQKDKDFQIKYCKEQLDIAMRNLTMFQRKIKELTGDE